jgi:hypothetical protein
MFSNALFLTPRLLLNDNVTRWIFIAIVGLVSAAGLWELNVTIVWTSLWAAIKFELLLVLFVAIYSIVGAHAPAWEGRRRSYATYCYRFCSLYWR